MELANLILDKSKQYSNFTAETLSELVKIPSLSGDEQRVIEKIVEIGNSVGLNEFRVDGLGNLILEIGEGERILAIDAHIDVVDTGELSQWEFDPFSGLIKDGKVHGRGSVDQKGGAASMLTAARILKELGYNGKFRVMFTFTIMEEDCDGLCWNYIIEREGIKPDFVVLTEPTNLGLYRGHRGRVEFELHFHGKSAHASAPERGVNAITKASKAVLAIDSLNRSLRTDPFLGKGSIAVTFIESRSPSLCAIPDYCRIHIDRRLTWGETKNSAIEELRNLVDPDVEIEVPEYKKASYKGTIFAQEKYFPTWKLPEDHPFVKVGMAAFEKLFGKPPIVGKWHFSTNGVATCGRHGIPTIGFGPGNEIYAHAPNEFVPIKHLEIASAFYALLPFVMSERDI